MSNGKRIFSTALKAWLVEQARRPGAPVAGLGMRFRVNPNQLQRWMRLQHLRQEGSEKAPILPVRAGTLGPTDEGHHFEDPDEQERALVAGAEHQH